MLSELQRLLRNSFLFNCASDSEFERALNSIRPYVISYEKSECICSPQNFERRLGFVVSGECEVLHRHADSADIRIKTLRRTDTFGIISVFSSDAEYPTTIVASKKCEVLYIDRSDAYKLIENHPRIARTIIEFFAERIRFMNSKVATFSASSVEQKMAQYIVNEARSQKSETIKLNKAKLALEIGVGRASLYRTLNHFSDDGLIVIDNKYIQIIDLEGLERIKK